MKTLITISIAVAILLSCGASKKAGCDAYSQHPADSQLKIGLDNFSQSASNWTTEQKAEFSNTFFIERGKFVVPTEPIVMKTFEGN
jgi:hypothetical protein